MSRWIYHQDEHGTPIGPPPKDLVGYSILPVHETPPHALSHANTEATDAQLEQDRLERAARSEFDQMLASDREILRLSQRLDGVREVRLQFPRAKREDQEQSGWLFVQALKHGYVLMVKSFPTQLTHAEIADRMRLTTRQVRYRLSKMSRDLVRFAVLRGWV